jgi:Flp pilus assembly protein TadB
MTRKTRGTETPIRITTAPTSAASDIAGRQRRYLIAMGIRTLCFAMVAVIAITGFGPVWLAFVFIAGAIVLPYVAVVMANATRSRSDGFELLDGRNDTRQLPPGTDSE